MKLNINSRTAIIDRSWVQVHDAQVPQPMAQFAMQLIDRWGMIAAAPDGEDSTGRAKFRLLEPHEVVTRACQTAQIAFELFAAQDWLLDVPVPPAEEDKKSLTKTNQPNQKDQP